MLRFSGLAVCTVIAVVMSGCSSTPKEECMYPGTRDDAPLWVCDAPVQGMAVGAVGSAQNSAAGIEFSKQMAATAARVRLAQTMKVRVQNMIKQYAETTGAGEAESVDQASTSVTKLITDQTLVGTKVFRSIQAPNGVWYVLVGVDESAAQKLTETAVRTSMNNDQAAWQQFKSGKSQDEMASDIAKQAAGN